MSVHGPRALSDLRRALDGMLNDPDVAEDLLIVGTALAHHVCVAPPPWRLEDAVSGQFMASRGGAVDRAKAALRADIPRLDPRQAFTGGALARHLPQIDWARVWDDLDGGRARPGDAAERTGLRLYLDVHDVPDTYLDDDERPALRLVR